MQKPILYEPGERQRHERWPMAERARIVAESFAPGVNVSAVARTNGVSLGLLHYWRRKGRDIGDVEEMRFVPVVVGDAEQVASTSGSIEIEISDVRIRLHGAVDGLAVDHDPKGVPFARRLTQARGWRTFSVLGRYVENASAARMHECCWKRITPPCLLN